MSLPGTMPFQFSNTMEMVFDNDAPKSARDMAEKTRSGDANKKIMDPVTTLIDFFVEEAFGKAYKDVIFKVTDRQKENAQRKKDGKKPINFQHPDIMKKDTN